MSAAGVLAAKDLARRKPETSLTSNLAEIDAPDFSLKETLESGQVFHWLKRDPGYVGLIGELPVYVEQRGDLLMVTAGAQAAAHRYFALDHPLREIYASFPQDTAMQEAVAFGRGLRIIRQPQWECVATFLTSSMKQVAHIAQISHTLRRRFGKAVRAGDETFHAYPEPAALAAAGEAALRECALGYRAKNLVNSARLVAEGVVDLSGLDAMEIDAAREVLCKLPGIGPKVANCALLFAFEHLSAFPIDVWIERVLREHYFKGRRKITATRMKEYAQKYFGLYGGYAQQYLFHKARKSTPRVRSKAKPKRKSKA